jgi:hypothetical protein
MWTPTNFTVTSIPSADMCRTARSENARSERKISARGSYADSNARVAAMSTECWSVPPSQ